MMELNYFKDDKNIFYFSDKEKMMKKIKNADIESFEIMNDDYAKDKNGEYYRGEKIRENRGIKQGKFQKNDIIKTGIEKKKG